MKSLAIVGSQWGDEGKGKITDFFAQEADVVVRWAGGDNAGHSINFNNQRYSLNILPSGVFNEKAINVISNGCVVNIEKLVSEIEMVKESGFKCNNLLISDRCHLIMPYHLVIDEQQEKLRSSENIGTTKRGIGPTYQDKYERIGIRMCDLKDLTLFKKKLLQNANIKNLLFTKIYNCEPINVEEIFEKYKNLYSRISHLVTNTSIFVNKAIKENKKVLFEGAQGVMLDIDHGTYPYVTSSHPSASGIPSDAGVSPKYINNILGITKAYSTRVGNGGFPSEIKGPIAEQIRVTGREFGVVSGRARRIGWFDAVVMKHSLVVSGYTHIAIMLLDVLSGIEKLKICTSYILDGKEIDYIPASIEDFSRCKPKFIELDGWKEDIKNVLSFDELPNNAKKYLDTISKIIGVNIGLISVGPNRDQTILLDRNIFGG